MFARLLLSIIMLFVGCFSVVGPACADDTVQLTVNVGDTLSNICRKYLDNPNNWRAVATVNRLKNPDRIYAGQRLIVPVDMLKGVPQDGLVTFIKGNVTARRSDGQAWETLRLKDMVAQGVLIRTGEESSVEITFKDGTSLFQGPGTELGLTASMQRGSSNFVKRLYLKAGKFITKIRAATGQENRFEVDTPAAVAVARGTEFRSSVDAGQTARFEVLEGTVSVEGLKRRVDVREKEGTIIRRGETPAPPVRLLPAPALAEPQPVYKRLPMRLAFSTVEGAQSYRVVLARDGAMKDSVRSEAVKPGEPFEVKGLDDGTYYLQTTSIDGNGIEGMPLDPLKVVLRTKPVPPFVQFPMDGGEYGGNTVEAKWLRVREAQGYQFQVAGEAGFSASVAEGKDVRDASAKVKLPEYGSYFFRIRSLASDGFEGDWSDSLRFSISALPPAPSVDRPQVGKDEIYLRWQDLGAGMKYRFQMARDESFSSPVMDKKVEKPEVIFPRPGEAGNYFIRTSSINEKGFEGDFSSPQMMEISKPFPYGILGAAGGALLILLLCL
jgi:hypothetical protein